MCLNFVTVEPYEIFLTTKVFQTTVVAIINVIVASIYYTAVYVAWTCMVELSMLFSSYGSSVDSCTAQNKYVAS